MNFNWYRTNFKYVGIFIQFCCEFCRCESSFQKSLQIAFRIKHMCAECVDAMDLQAFDALQSKRLKHSCGQCMPSNQKNIAMTSRIYERANVRARSCGLHKFCNMNIFGFENPSLEIHKISIDPCKQMQLKTKFVNWKYWPIWWYREVRKLEQISSHIGRLCLENDQSRSISQFNQRATTRCSRSSSTRVARHYVTLYYWMLKIIGKFLIKKMKVHNE